MSETNPFEDYVFSLPDDRFEKLKEAVDTRIDRSRYGFTSFEEAAFFYDRKPLCPVCGSQSCFEDGHTSAGHKRYRCKDCNESYMLLSDSIFNSAKISMHKLLNYIQLMSFNAPLQLLCEVLDISNNTTEL